MFGTLGRSFFRQLWLDAFLRKECYCKQRAITVNFRKYLERFLSCDEVFIWKSYLISPIPRSRLEETRYCLDWER